MVSLLVVLGDVSGDECLIISARFIPTLRGGAVAFWHLGTTRGRPVLASTMLGHRWLPVDDLPRDESDASFRGTENFPNWATRRQFLQAKTCRIRRIPVRSYTRSIKHTSQGHGTLSRSPRRRPPHQVISPQRATFPAKGVSQW